MVKTIIDIKTGKVMPWTALQVAAYTLLDSEVTFTEEEHKYEIDGITLESVTGILKAEGFIDSRFYTEEGRERGEFVHLAVHYFETGELDQDTLDPTIIPYLNAWIKFKSESSFIVEQTETPMMSKIYKYAGTPDITGYFDNSKVYVSRGAVELHNNGTYKLIPYKERSDINQWLAVLSVHNWKVNNLKNWRM